MDEIIGVFPVRFHRGVLDWVGDRWGSLQEIRVRVGRPVEFIFNEGFEFATSLIPDERDGVYMLNRLGDYSIYRLEDELREGYITLHGGHRVGLAGRVNTEGGRVKAISTVTSFNIRIAKEKVGVASGLIRDLYRDGYENTLFIGPPQTGKTTLLRDLARLISEGNAVHAAHKVGIVDERSEIAGSLHGIPQHQVGLRTDVLDACPKAEGMMMMIRSLSPEVLIVDEIGSEADVKALREAVYAGVCVITTAHGQSFDELMRRPSFAPLMSEKAFKRYVVLLGGGKPGVIGSVLDEEGQLVRTERGNVSNEVDWSTNPVMRNHMGRV
ncbi:stage III sporulation protein AA [Pontibacillus halophilus JSM 076056 = DSM 19796]|uniref:Stage III sporulation protein AA n=1 Tax=Pontibacillus halophilus JSM 076056 = DSM 19796 TaxID=1385510 RepID=A0A0A5GFV6_9BACI|nr:stage III sporulation protein AA [Pontibacillus halophilus]KGX90899.1 stage III sporulation protein AA [Pontibacillus halophilus JSM 076056 = DSM 19796]